MFPHMIIEIDVDIWGFPRFKPEKVAVEAVGFPTKLMKVAPRRRSFLVQCPFLDDSVCIMI